jgi:sialate O-acetylesterase
MCSSLTAMAATIAAGLAPLFSARASSARASASRRSSKWPHEKRNAIFFVCPNTPPRVAFPRPTMRAHVLVVVVVLAVAVARAAAQGLPQVFASHMVLQAAPLSARVWGTAARAGAAIEVVLTVTAGGAPNPQRFNATADGAGAWSLLLPPQPASINAVYRLEVADVTSGTGEAFEDVLFGDVWLCSGQSNMEQSVPMTFNPAAEIADSVNYPAIRVLSALRSAQDLPQADVGTRGPAPWSVASPVALSGGDYDYFSAVCYMFGRELQRTLNIPIGLISSAWGGTIVEAWMSPEALARCAKDDAEKPMATRPWRGPAAPAAMAARQTADPNDRSALWNGMIVPYLPFTLKGATWYQGESNAGNPTAYACLFPAMIDDWRARMQPNLGFYFVQLAPYNGGGLLPALRQAQTNSEGLLQRMAVTIDLWDPLSPYGEIHPRGKAPVGKRLALQALATTYGRNVDAAGPVVVDAVADNAVRVVRITMGSRHPSQYAVRGMYDCAANCAAVFEVGTAAGTWATAASVSVAGNVVTVGYPATVNAATGVRYAWSDIPLCALFDENGLPARPFSLAL